MTHYFRGRMNPWIELGIATIPNNGGELKFSRREDEFSIRLSGIRGELMNSRVHGSEEALAELGCAHLKTVDDAKVLVGGLGMGFTLAAALRTASMTAQVTVAELIPEVIDWNQGPLGDCAGHPLRDPRTQVHVGDVAELLSNNKPRFDAILLDVDNGPEGLTNEDNHWLYSLEGLHDIYRTLRPNGMLAIWSAGSDPLFTIRLKKAGFKVDMRTVRARPGKGSRHTIFLAQKPWRPRKSAAQRGDRR
jgi:spermidine synthase